jgi:hypothetical protein
MWTQHCCWWHAEKPSEKQALVPVLLLLLLGRDCSHVLVMLQVTPQLMAAAAACWLTEWQQPCLCWGCLADPAAAAEESLYLPLQQAEGCLLSGPCAQHCWGCLTDPSVAAAAAAAAAVASLHLPLQPVESCNLCGPCAQHCLSRARYQPLLLLLLLAAALLVHQPWLLLLLLLALAMLLCHLLLQCLLLLLRVPALGLPVQMPVLSAPWVRSVQLQAVALAQQLLLLEHLCRLAAAAAAPVLCLALLGLLLGELQPRHDP